MEIFLLLSALICGLTGTARTAVVSVPGVVASRSIATSAEHMNVAERALTLARARPEPVRPANVPTPIWHAIDIAFAPIVVAITPERRRE